LMQYIWRVVHPPSYFLMIKSVYGAGDFKPGKMDRWYLQYADMFKDVPMDFNIFSKRVISVVVGTGMHWCAYFAFHLGKKLCQPVATTRSGKQRPRPFITAVESLNLHEPGAPEDLFVVFLFDFILQLEKWITRVVNQPEGEGLSAPNLFVIANECRQRTKEGESLFNDQEFEQHNLYYRQSDQPNCGIFLLINVSAVYVANTLFHQNWLEIQGPVDLFTKVLKPYFDVAKGSKKQAKELDKWASWFRFNLISLLTELAPNKHFHVLCDGTGSYSLHLDLPGGKSKQSEDEGAAMMESQLVTPSAKRPLEPTKWTDSRRGNSQYMGWHEDAYTRYDYICRWTQQQRSSPHSTQLELRFQKKALQEYATMQGGARARARLQEPTVRVFNELNNVTAV
jgi:hypothetical protein